MRSDARKRVAGMSEQTEGAEVEALASELAQSHTGAFSREAARFVLASDWLAAREAAAAERALREAAEEFEAEDEPGRIVGRLRARAAQVAPSRVPSEET